METVGAGVSICSGVPPPPQVVTSLPKAPLGSVAIVDVNGDGKPDLVVSNSGGGSITVLINQGDGTFGDRIDYDTDSTHWEFAAVHRPPE